MRYPFLPLFLAVPFLCAAQAPLWIPPTLVGPNIDLALQEGTHEFHSGETVPTYGYNGDVLGPTLILQRGEQVTLNVTNLLPDLTTTHWHGLHVSPMNDGGPHSLIYPNTTWSPSFTVMDRASTFWYHPHGHGLTDYQVSMGAAGMIIVRDDAEAALDLPRTYGVDDIPLIIQAKSIMDGQIMLHTGLDSLIVVNGVRQPMAQAPAQVVRLRCLNGASERTFLLGFSNGMPFQVIGTDGGLLSAPVQRQRLQLMPGERVELLIDLNGMEGMAFDMMAYNSELTIGIIGSPQVGNGMATLDGYEQNALNGADHTLLSFSVGAPTAGAITSIPAALVPTLPLDPADAANVRTFVVAPEAMSPMEMIEGPFTMNGVLMDMDVINEVVELGSTEIWEFQNNTMVGHPIHVHDVQFNILDRDGLPPQPWELGWKDVVYVPPQGTARVLMRFDDHADPEMPYMYHCHLLMHEDEGMMGQFLVVEGIGLDEHRDQVLVNVQPNPAMDGTIRFTWPKAEGVITARLVDAMGRTIHTARFANPGTTPVAMMCATSPGHYTLNLTDEQGRTAHALVTTTH